MTRYGFLVPAVLAGLLITTLARAETGGSLPSLKMAPDARSAALGEAGTAGARGAMAAFHNPALLSFSDRNQAAFAYTDWLLDLSLQTGALLLRQSDWTVGLSFNVFSVPDLEQRMLPSDDPLGLFDAHDLAAGLSLAYQVTDRLSLGATGRYVYQQIYVENASGFSGDFGAAWKPRGVDLTVAAALRNVGRMEPLQQERSPLPTSANLGLAGLILQGPDFALRGLADGQYLFDDDLRLHAGLEAAWKELFFLRAGYQTGSELRSLSGGAGLQWKRFGFDYAYQPLAEDFGSSHRVALSVNF
ncbi:MAG: hypothetical protein C4524_13230 [Candidatus Zixiibacteriota bacterium]|nr:MAG: hypothetical protein C4524_13230 [candidate division Zixibacteria bacterium]